MHISQNPYSNLIEINQDRDLVQAARNKGQTYLVDPAMDLFDRSVATSPAREHANQLVKDRNGNITVANIPDNVGDDSGREVSISLPGKGPNGAWTSEQQEFLEKEVVGHIHSHPLSSNTPSPNDVLSTAGDTKPGYMNLVANQKNIVFYYSANSQMGNTTHTRTVESPRDYGNHHNALFINCTANFIGEEICAKANYNIIFNKSYVGPKRKSKNAPKTIEPKPSFERSR